MKFIINSGSDVSVDGIHQPKFQVYFLIFNVHHFDSFFASCDKSNFISTGQIIFDVSFINEPAFVNFSLFNLELS